jgi:mannose-6-phosphate isomerase
MFVGISNTPRDYAWGSTTAIAELLGRPATGRPEAELWLGSHAGSPSRVDDPTLTGGHTELAGWIELPFLLKVLAAASPLSLQAHPTTEQAELGFARENAAGLAVDAPNRNYRDASAKPEHIVALVDGFEALCGFREPELALEVFTLIAHRGEGPAFEPLLRCLTGADPMRAAFEWFMSTEHGEPAVLDNLCTAAAEAEGTDHDRPDFALVRMLAAQYPGDPGIGVSMLLNHVSLSAGEAIYLPAGNIHAYLSGLGIELMAASDNVLRGGLTPKHVDVPELMSILDFTSVPVPYLRPDAAPGLQLYRPDGVALALARVSGDAALATDGASIVLCVGDSATITGLAGSVTLARGEAVLATADEGTLRFTATDDAFVAAAGLAAA